MVSRAYPPPVSPRKARSAKPGSGPVSPSVGDDTAPTEESPGTSDASLSDTPPAGPKTNISPLGRNRAKFGSVSATGSAATSIVPTISGADLAWPREERVNEQFSEVSKTGLRQSAGEIDAESLSIHNELSNFVGAAPASVAAPTLTLERPTVRPTADVSPRFDFESESERITKVSRSRRMVQGTVLLALIAAVAAFIVILPEDPSTSGENAETATRIRTVDTPTATAELLSSSNRPPVEAALGDAGELERVTAFSGAGSGAPGQSAESFEAALALAVEEAEPEQQATTTTTTWVEPTIPPESEWIDAGSGVMVPDLLLRIRFCESTNNYQAANSSSTARGAYQFLNKSWEWYGHAARTGVAEAHLATRAQQDESALLTLQDQGTAPWLASRGCWGDENIDPRYATASPRPVTTTTTVPDQGSSTSESTDDSSTSTSTDDSTPDTTAPDESSSTTETTGPTTSTPAGDETTTTATSTTTTTSTTNP